MHNMLDGDDGFMRDDLTITMLILTFMRTTTIIELTKIMIYTPVHFSIECPTCNERVSMSSKSEAAV